MFNNRTKKSIGNISGRGPTSTAVNNAVLAAYRKGMTLVAAAGNGYRVSHPGSCPPALMAPSLVPVSTGRGSALRPPTMVLVSSAHVAPSFFSSSVLMLVFPKALVCSLRARTHSLRGLEATRQRIPRMAPPWLCLTLLVSCSTCRNWRV